MVTFHIITLFPQFFRDTFCQHSIIKKGLAKALFQVNVIDLRRYGVGSCHQVDDYQCGGGPGMVLKVDVLVHCLEAVQQQIKKSRIVIMMTPQGQVWTQHDAHHLIKVSCDHDQDLVLICGHYEGIDERILKYVDLQVSIGDYVLSSGDLAGAVIIDSMVRLIPGVINLASLQAESFTNFLLDYPAYTKPLVFRGDQVPAVLISGHHQKITAFRHQAQIKKTKAQRPDLFKKFLNQQKKW